MSPRTDVLGVLLPGLDGAGPPGWLADRLRAGLAGVCLFADDVASPRRRADLTAAIREASPMALVAVDEEGGDVTRLHAGTGSPFPGNAWLGRLDDEAETARVAGEVGRQLRAAGCNLDLAPGLDVNSNSANPVIGVRSFGADPGLVARHGAAWLAALQAEGVACCVKHFPGHGDTAVDSHRDLPVVDASREQLEGEALVPFRAALAAGAATVMTGHLLVRALDAGAPATFSTAVVDDLLRTRLGFAGVVVSDALDMAGAGGSVPEAAVRALVGGCDLLCLGSGTGEAALDEVESAIGEALASGRLEASRLRDAARRVRVLAERFRLPVRSVAATPAPAPGSSYGDLLVSRFEVQPRVAALVAGGGPWSHVALASPPDPATGTRTPWGPAAVLGAQVAVADPSTRAGDLPDGPVALVGRGNHGFDWVRGLVDDARTSRSELVVVDMGWPDPGRDYSDVATFGGSRLLGEALLRLLPPPRGSTLSREPVD